MKDVIKQAVDRFLGWRLPVEFFPDHYITFDAERARAAHGWPTGTNLFHAGQAQAMFEYCLQDFLGPLNGSLPERDTSKPAEQQGLFRKFNVSRVDGSDVFGGKHYGCSYYVLDLDHDEFAPAAMQAYAAACRATHPMLADDIERKFGSAANLQAIIDRKTFEVKAFLGDTEPLAGQTWQAPTVGADGKLKVVEGRFGKQACSDLARQLRDMADAVERGEIVDFVASYIQRGEYQTFYAAALDQSLVLASLLLRRCVDRFFVGD